MQELQPDDPAAIGPYRLSARLGEGGMGQVFLAESRSGRRLAVKVIRPQIAADPGFRERFRREVAAARTVGGFWTAPIVDADPDGPVPWVASDYIDAPDLEALVRDRGPLPEPELRSLAAGLAEALEAVHRAGLVHRDLKPSNILVTDTGPRLIDFGISKAAEGATALTGTGLVVGTPGFMSPEQATGAPVGAPSDVFALGAVLSFAATGAAPFGEGSAPALLYRVVHDAPALDGVPPGLRPVVAACLEKSPRRRPSPAGLLDLLDAGGPAAGPTPPTRPAPRTTPVTRPEPVRRARAGTPPPDGPAPSLVEVRAGASSEPDRNMRWSTRVMAGGCVMVFPLPVVVFTFAPWPVAALTAVVGVAVVVTGGRIARRSRNGPPPLGVVTLTGEGLRFRLRDAEWTSAWTHIERITVRPAPGEGTEGRRWLVETTLGKEATPPPASALMGTTAPTLPLVFTEDQDPLTALRELDGALRRFAGRRYSRDDDLAAHLR